MDRAEKELGGGLIDKILREQQQPHDRANFDRHQGVLVRSEVTVITTPAQQRGYPLWSNKTKDIS